MKTENLTKREALKIVKSAGNRLATGQERYSCLALQDCGATEKLRLCFAGRVLGFSLADYSTVHTECVKLGLRPENDDFLDRAAEDREHRLFLLAMFHTLIESGDLKP